MIPLPSGGSEAGRLAVLGAGALPDGQEATPGLTVGAEGETARLGLGLVGAPRGLEHFTLASPPGVAIKLGRARLETAPGTYRPGSGFRQVIIRRQGGTTQVRIYFEWSDRHPRVEAVDGLLRVELHRK